MDGFADALKAQRSYVKSLNGKSVGLIVAPTFVRSIRQSGYLNTATALFELIDNSIEARARTVHIVFGFSDASAAKPTSIAVIDDGHGMDPAMLRIALAWGGTHRENGRAGLGRFGYGLPTSCVSQGRKFSVYSHVDGHSLHRASLDIEILGAARAGSPKLPRPVRGVLPTWIEEYARKFKVTLGQKGGHGTAVVIENLDNLSWKTAIALERNLDRFIGVTYRNYFGETRIVLQGREVQPIDPLFTTAGARYVNLDPDRAIAVPAAPIQVYESRNRPAGTVKVRAAYFPVTFARKDKTREASGLNANARFAVMKENNGLIVMRNGRQVDVVMTGLWTQFQNNDRYWAVELDFPAQLDEWFSVTTNKQRINMTESLKEALRRGGLPELIEGLRARYKGDRRKLRPQAEVKLAVASVASNGNGHGHVRLESLPGGTFYLIRKSDDNIVLNQAHPFFERLYSRTADSPQGRAAVDAVIAALSRAEAEADPDGKRFYRQERRKWSDRLAALLEDPSI